MAGIFVPCHEGHQWCLYNMSKKNIRCVPCSWCHSAPQADAEISYSAFRKLPHTLEHAVPLCYPCITSFLAQHSGQDTPERQRYDMPCCGTPCVEAVQAVIHCRASGGALQPWTRGEFSNGVKRDYGVPSEAPPHAAADAAQLGPQPQPVHSLADVYTEILNVENAMVHRVEESETNIVSRVEKSEEKVCKMIAGIHQRLEALEIAVRDQSQNSRSWTWGSK